ncbi:hypothetical protein [Euzebya tangerina]|uniref:hypothetical protein n=1 Tax=Euzebya tangerina TaxID=591198 RepID=UPI0013C3434B|nr:hypothetical protein [Euzebya tangerina]
MVAANVIASEGEAGRDEGPRALPHPREPEEEIATAEWPQAAGTIAAPPTCR